MEIIIPLAALCLASIIICLVMYDSDRPTSFVDYPDTIRSAAFRYINMPHLWESYLGGTIAQIEQRRAHIHLKRSQASSISNAELRNCVIAYLDYHERKLPVEEQELIEKTTKRNLEAYRLKRTVEEKKIKELLKREQN